MQYLKTRILKKWVAALLALLLVFQLGLTDLTPLKIPKAYAAGTQPKVTPVKQTQNGKVNKLDSK